MNEIIVFLGSLVVSFAAVFLYKKINSKRNFATGIDVNKADKRKIPEGAGIALLLPVWLGILYLNFLFGFRPDYIAWGLTATIFAVIGLLDDLRHKFAGITLPWIARAAPIAGVSLAVAYFFAPNIFWIVPVALFIAGLAAFQNTFAGLNGWEVGSGFIITVFTALLLAGTSGMLPALVLAGSVLGLLLWNNYPAKVFPGDSGTLLIGSSIASIVVVTGKTEFLFIVPLFFIPHIIDFFLLKLLTNTGDVTQSKILPYSLQGNGKLAIPDYKDGKTRYDFAKLVLRILGPLEERKIVIIIWIVVTVNCLMVLLLYKYGFLG